MEIGKNLACFLPGFLLRANAFKKVSVCSGF